ncbi:AMP-binding protein [Halobacillus sp. HZG1]|uniref:phenylacetate--CoA ligase family protein n=1 Tax=Halobacillus sp. HZG1 TaxID=3111769 RepID=UPI002DB5D4FC|nr:AMP-binding protein [Halobacillus sp. HZG1]MEC3885153.1 AMP-binding protein [Halobacillus sp. HZG1]
MEKTTVNIRPRKMNVEIEGHQSFLEKHVPFFEKLDEEDRAIETISNQEINEFHLEALNSTLRHAWENNEFYRKKMIEVGMDSPLIDSLSSLSKVPFLKKTEIAGDRSKLLCCPTSEVGQVHSTSGTTGKPMYVSYTLADQFKYDVLPKYPVLFPDSDEDVVAVCLPYEIAQPGLGFQRVYQFVFGATVISLGKGGYMAPVQKSLELMKEYQTTILATTPSYAALLAEESEKLGYKLGDDIELRRLILTGEGCSPEFRSRLEELYGCQATFFYGSTECGMIGVECSEQHGYHVVPGHVKVEIIHPETEKVLNYGDVGEIVVTTLMREGMPIIRYRTGDMGYLMKSTCDAGVSSDILHLRGRKEHQICLYNEEFSPYLLENFLLQVKDIGLWFEFIISDKELTINVERYQTSLSNEQIIDKVEGHISSTLGFNCKVVVKEKIDRTYEKVKRVYFQ